MATSLNTGDERARFPYFPFYVDDWLSSTVVDLFTLEQKGLYLTLLLRQWKARDGLLPSDETTLAGLCRMPRARWVKVGRPVLAQCFTARGAGLVNEKLYALWKEARTRSVKATAAAAARWSND